MSAGGSAGPTAGICWPAAHAQLPGGRLVLVWDRVNAHRQAEMATFLDAHAGWVSAVLLPAYASELNPAEGVWSWLKRAILANLVVRTMDEVYQRVRHGLKQMQYRSVCSSDSSPKPAWPGKGCDRRNLTH